MWPAFDDVPTGGLRGRPCGELNYG
ncbi:hypothetical protein H7K24_01375 [Mycobacterium fragae]|nr:hypothetical protein [Mycobacterium fragae]